MLLNSSLFRRIELQLLMNLTARALGKPSKRIWTLSNGKALRVYAQYTREYLKGHIDQHLLERMHQEAFKMGQRLRMMFHLRKSADVEQFTFALYKNIGITMNGNIPGNLCVRHCFFSRFYSPAVCLAASALDSGIISGLSGGGQLTFQQRITEGCLCCIATFKKTNI